MAQYAGQPTDQDLIQISKNAPAALRGLAGFLKINITWSKWLSGLQRTIVNVPQAEAPVRRRAVAAAISVTPLLITTVRPGVWSVAIQVRVTQVASVSSSLRIGLTWTQGVTTQQQTGTILVGNALTTREGVVWVIRVDAGQPISYFVDNFTSVGGTPMQYEIDVVPTLIAEDTTS